MDGEVIIKTSLETKQFDKQIDDINKRLKELEKKGSQPIDMDGVKVTGATLSEEEIAEYDDLKQKLTDIYREKLNVNDITSKTNKNLQEQNKLINNVKNENTLNTDETSKLRNELQEALTLYKEIEKQDFVSDGDLEALEKLKEKIKNITKEYKKITGEEISIPMVEAEPKTNKIGEAISNNVKKMGKWALAIFSVRSAYNLVQRAVSILSGQNEELAGKINFIKSSLANALAPVIDWLVNQAYKLVYYVGYILKAWFGIDIFAKRTSKNMNNTNKSAMKLRKTLAGFDEMNILQDNVASSGSSGLGDTFKGLDKPKIPEWVDWIAKNKDEVLDTLKRIGIELALIAGTAGFLKLTGDVAGLWNALRNLSTTLSGITLLKGGLYAVAGALAIMAVVQFTKVIKSAIELNKQLKNLLELSSNSAKSWKEQTNEMQKNAKQGKYNTEEQKYYNEALLTTIENNKAINKGIEKQSKVRQILTGTYNKNNEIMKINNEEIQDNLNKLTELYNMGKLTEEQKTRYAQILNDEITRLEKVNGTLDKNSNEYQKNSDKIKKMREEFGKITGSTYDVKLKVDADTKPANKSISGFLKNIGSTLFGSIFPGLNFANTLKKFKFAKGGIINMPGKGVPLLNAVGGERGQEGIVPLTDSQQMELLGRAIGKYITLNATIITEMNGRVIGRELKKVDTDNDFATNN